MSEEHDRSGQHAHGLQAHRLLVIEDDVELAGLLATLMGWHGYDVDVAGDGHRGLHYGLSRPYDVMIIDRRLPAIEGLEVLIKLRKQGVTARALMLSALGDLADRVDGLDAGADDYLVKPFEVAELVARVRALDRRVLAEAEMIPVGRAYLDVGAGEVSLPGGVRVPLSRREFDLLRMLAIRPAAIHSRDRLREILFEDTKAESIVDTYVYYLRRKLGGDVIRTVRGFGYQIGAI